MENRTYRPEVAFNFTEKLYVWSIVFEPLLFFVVASQGVTAVGGNISRLLQLIVIILLIIRALSGHSSSFRIPNPLYSQYRWYFIYLIFIIISVFFGIFSGAYESALNSAITTHTTTLGTATSGFSLFLNGPWVRPLFEYFIAIYYFLYFVVLAQYLLASKKAIKYFIKVFIGMFFLSFWIGVIDYLLLALIEYAWIPRHISDWRHVGLRFHGLAGEPRDAFVYLVFGSGLLFLREHCFGKQRFTNVWFFLLVVAAFLTQSTSGFIGILLATVLIFVYQLRRMSLGNAIPLLLTVTIISAFSVFSILNSPRVLLYLNAVPGLLIAFERNIDLPPVFFLQITNIYPVWLRWNDLLELNLLPLFIGTGFGSASVANGIILGVEEVLNPHSNLVRIAFEGGIIGSLLFIYAFYHPIKQLSLSKQNFDRLVFFLLLILGVNLSHRSATLYIFLGLTLVIFNYKKNIQSKISV